MKSISTFSNTISGLILIFIWIFTIINFQKLPEIIPTHFNFSGKPDGFGSKNSLWFLLAVATACFALMLYLSKNPSSPLLNIPTNLKENPKIGRLVVNILNFILMLMFADINYESIAIALGKSKESISAIGYLGGSLLIFIIGMMIYSVSISNSQTRKDSR
ncbi:DUF1648 domain-containing protein [Chryseobacterium sp. SC28]|uniref:DUF1648 domain-containing protein n=1 Tax=Chryseobacterium sp. SC28 TaxID=2268028 RepID=UPI000F646581|nr:DUF1648 domain-containing protein [Chryseobacterium sp. SC28]RRQ46761.1 DUF1648 domain-containing protein [Chryseobacterium sp. SC28]